MKKRLSLLLTGVLVALRCLIQRLQELFPAHLSRSTTEHLIEKNVHSLIICDAIFVTVWHEHHLPSFSNLTSPKAPFNEAVPSSLNAFAENEQVLRSKAADDTRGVVLAWLFHLIGDIGQPLHTIQLFSGEYPNGDRGGNEMCVRPSLNGAPVELHRYGMG